MPNCPHGKERECDECLLEKYGLRHVVLPQVEGEVAQALRCAETQGSEELWRTIDVLIPVIEEILKLTAKWEEAHTTNPEGLHSLATDLIGMARRGENWRAEL